MPFEWPGAAFFACRRIDHGFPLAWLSAIFSDLASMRLVPVLRRPRLHFQRHRERDDGLGCPLHDPACRFDRARHLGVDRLENQLVMLPNRGLFMDRLNLHIKHSTRDDSSIYILFIDLDGFKDINDTLGHDAGDELLQEVALRLKKCVRATDTVARFGGDEFAIMLAGGIEIYAVERVIASILDQLHEPFTLNQGIHRISASIGVAIYPNDTINPGTLLQYADTAMYRAKEKGRDSAVFFQANMNDQVVERARVKQKIFEAIENSEFILHFQPIVDLGNHRIVGAEALLRWQHPHEGLIMPGKFISISEETGQIVLIGKWVLEQAIQQLAQWRKLFGRDFYISVNLSPRQLYEDSLIEFIAGLPDEDLRQLVFEITESIFLDTHQIAVKTLELIQSKGGKISIDDFGTGYSSLTYLRSFPVNTVKIDQSFIRQGSTIIPPNDAFIEAILALAQGIGAKVVAEGIETGEQLEFLRLRACHSGQGFYFAKPMRREDFENFMQNWK
jgi:diguanylate cyclase (GGDEF)-like protein